MSWSYFQTGTPEAIIENLKSVNFAYDEGGQAEAARQFVLADLAFPRQYGQNLVRVEMSGHSGATERGNTSIVITAVKALGLPEQGAK